MPGSTSISHKISQKNKHDKNILINIYEKQSFYLFFVYFICVYLSCIYVWLNEENDQDNTYPIIMSKQHLTNHNHCA